MKVIGKTSGHRGAFIVEVDWWEMAKLVGDGVRLDKIETRAEIQVSGMFTDYHDLKNRIKLAGTDSPRNLRALADLLEGQVEPVTQPEEGK